MTTKLWRKLPNLTALADFDDHTDPRHMLAGAVYYLGQGWPRIIIAVHETEDGLQLSTRLRMSDNDRDEWVPVANDVVPAELEWVGNDLMIEAAKRLKEISGANSKVSS